MDQDYSRNILPMTGTGSLHLDMNEELNISNSYVFVLDRIACGVVDAALVNGYTQVGTVTLKQDNRKSECVTRLYSNSSECCLVYQCGDIPDSLHSTWTQLFFNDTPCKSCLVLSGLSVASYNSDTSLGGLRVLFSSAVEEDTKKVYSDCTLLETGKIISGCAASVLCQCEYDSLEAIVCVSLCGLSYSPDAAKMFDLISPQVSSFLGVERLSFSGNSEYHTKMIKSDQFLSRTENMYV